MKVTVELVGGPRDGERHTVARCRWLEFPTGRFVKGKPIADWDDGVRTEVAIYERRGDGTAKFVRYSPE